MEDLGEYDVICGWPPSNIQTSREPSLFRAIVFSQALLFEISKGCLKENLFKTLAASYSLNITLVPVIPILSVDSSRFATDISLYHMLIAVNTSSTCKIDLFSHL